MIATVHAHNPQQRFAVTFFRSLDAGDADEQVTTLDALADVIRTAHATHKAQLPLLSMARYGRQRSPKGSLRHAANLLSVTGVEADYDQGEIDREEAALALREAGIACIIYTTPRSRFQAPRWRVLAPLSHEHPPDERGRLLARLNGVLQGIIAPESFVLSQSYYYGQTDETEGYTVEVIDGLEIDTLNGLDATAIWPARRRDGERASYTKTTPSSLGFDLHSRRILTPEELTVILRLMPNGPGEETPWRERDDWQKLGHAIAGATGHAVWAREAWIEWSAQIDGDMTEPARFWDTLGPVIRAGFSTLRRYFDAHHGEGALERMFPETSVRGDEKSSSAPGSRLFQSSAEFVAGFTPPDWLFNGFLQRNYLYSMTAKTGAGKTCIGLLLALCLGIDKPFGGFPVFRRGRIAYLAGENPPDVRARWIGLTEHHKVQPADVPVFFMPTTLDLEGERARIAAEIEEIGGVDLVVVDTGAAFFQGDDPNNNAQAKEFAQHCRAFTRMKGEPCVLVLMHPTKDAARERLVPYGGGAFLNEVDGNLTCWKEENEMITTVHHGKMRGPEFDPFTVTLEVVEPRALKDSQGGQMKTVIARPTTPTEAERQAAQAESDENLLLRHIAHAQGLSLRQLGGRVQWGKTKVAKVIRRLSEDKLVRRTRGYWLTGDGKAEARRLGYLRDGEDNG